MVSGLAVGGRASGFLMRAADELPEPPPLSLQEQLQVVHMSSHIVQSKLRCIDQIQRVVVAQ